MGFFSWTCAKSGESIPNQQVEPCSVTIFMPDGTKVAGFYDGYGRIEADDVIVSVYEDVPKRAQAAGRWQPTPPNKAISVTEEVENGEKVWKVAMASGARYTKSQADFPSQKEAMASAESWANKIDFKAVTPLIKIVKTKYVTDDMTFDNLPASGDCPFQGYFYSFDGQWDYKVVERKKRKTH